MNKIEAGLGKLTWHFILSLLCWGIILGVIGVVVISGIYALFPIQYIDAPIQIGTVSYELNIFGIILMILVFILINFLSVYMPSKICLKRLSFSDKDKPKVFGRMFLIIIGFFIVSFVLSDKTLVYIISSIISLIIAFIALKITIKKHLY